MMKQVENFNGGIYGKEPLFNVREISTLKEMFETSTKMYAERVAFLEKFDSKEAYTEITFKQFRDDVYAFATGLLDMGLQGKKVAVIGENSYRWIVTYMSVVTGVGTIVPIDKELPYDEIKYLLDFSGCEAIVASKKILKNKPELWDCGIKVISMGDGETSMDSVMEKGRELLASGDKTYENAEVLPDDVNIILFTSGTTGVSKGVMLSHRNICSNLMNICAVFKITEEDRVFSVLPLHHTYECTCGHLAEIYVGASVAYCQGLKYLVKNMQEVKPTMFFAVPLILQSIYKMLNRTLEKKGKAKTVKKGIAISKFLLKFGIDIRRKLFSEIIENFGGELKMFLVGAAHIEPEILQFFTDIGITSIQGYGMTECSPLIAANRVCRHRNESAGLPIPEIYVEIDNPDENGIGEIIAKGDSVMVGYYNNPEETEKTLKDGWLHTGDLGYIDKGFIHITGRSKNVIITANGKNVFPEEIEGYLCRSKYISESMVYEAEIDGKKVLSAQVYPEAEAIEEALGKDCSHEEITALIEDEVKVVNKDIPQWKAVANLIVRKEPFIKTTTQKIKRSANI